MVKKLFSFYLLLLPLLGYSQTNVKLGEPYKVIDADEKYYFSKGSEILTIKIAGSKIYLQKLNATSLSQDQMNVFDDMPDDFVLEEIAEFNGRYFLFYSLWDRPNKTEQLFYKEIDFEKGIFKEDKLLIKVEGKITGSMISNGWYNVSVQDKFDFLYSKGNEKLLIQYRVKPEIRDDSKSYDIIGLNVFDKNLGKVWAKQVTMPYTEKKMNNLDYSVDSEGNAYILTTVYDDNTTKLKNDIDQPNYHIELLKIKGNSNDIGITPVSITDKFISKIWIYETSNEYMTCAGFYNDGKTFDAVNGIFLFKVTKDGKLYDTKSYEIPLEILNMYVSAKTQKRNEKQDEKGNIEFQDLELRELRVSDKGDIILIGEQYFVRSHTTYSSSGGSRTYYTYHYNDMLITKIDASGKLAWMKKLPKRQVGTRGRGGMSYKYMFGGNSHFLMFLDNEKNIDLPKDQVPEAHKDGLGGFLTAYKIDDVSGNTEKISIMDLRNVNGIQVYQFYPGRIIPLEDGKFLVEVYKKQKEDVLLKVDLGK